MIEEVIQLPFDVPLLPVQNLKAGDISCFYENGNLRYIKFCGEEIIRMIYPAVRGTSWETAIPTITDQQINIRDNSFEICYTAIFRLNDIQYKAIITISGREDNSISFMLHGEALATFKTRRIGLCVHHPIEECKGKQVIVTRPDNTFYTADFPDFVSPHQPFIGVQQMYWTNKQDHAIQVLFKGDVFETEDQRNWTDNSYKTYSTPLERPSPVVVEKGAEAEQQVEIRITKNKIPVNKVVTEINIEKDKEKIPIPKIGFTRIPGSNSLTNQEILALTNIPFDHYRVELIMSSPDWKEELGLAFAEAEKLNASIELIVFFSNSFEVEISQLLRELLNFKNRIDSILPLHTEHDVTPDFLIRSLYAGFKKTCPAVNIGYGTNAFFAELNRNRPVSNDFDFVSFSLNPQVHATDTRTIIENLESQEQVMTSIGQFTSKPVHVSPVTFQQRSESAKDPRLHSFFGAAWTLLSLKNLSGARSITMYQTTGDNGILLSPGSENESHSPLYGILTQLKKFQPMHVFTGGKKDEIIFENKAGKRLTYLVQNLFEISEAHVKR